MKHFNLLTYSMIIGLFLIMILASLQHVRIVKARHSLELAQDSLKLTRDSLTDCKMINHEQDTLLDLYRSNPNGR